MKITCRAILHGHANGRLWAGANGFCNDASSHRGEGSEIAGDLVGLGHIDNKPIRATAAKPGIKGCYIEQELPLIAMTPMEAVEVDYRYLRAI
jgi:hypothetical protein